jgi:hypothetical protein
MYGLKGRTLQRSEFSRSLLSAFQGAAAYIATVVHAVELDSTQRFVDL